MLWIDLTVSVQDARALQEFRSLFDIHSSAAMGSMESEIERISPALLCFDFDFPTKQGLKALQRIKQTYPAIPVLMLTVQHSEALAVWAFRSRVWDYLVKPLTPRDTDRCLCGLTEMLNLKENQATARKAARQVTIIPEENRLEGPRGRAPLVLEAAIRYVEQGYRDKVSSAKAAEMCNLTPFQFSRLFKETYGLPFREYLLRFRVREACRLLKNPNAQVTEVAHLVGFNDPSYFGKVFRRYTNLTPSHFSSAGDAVLDPERLLESVSAE